MRVRLLFAAPARLSYGSNMLPDLRFVIGAVLATVVLGVTALGLISSIRLAHESRTAPLEATRPLAYTAPTGLATQAVRPGDVAQQPGGPFEKVPAGGTVTAQAPAAPEPDAPAAESTPSRDVFPTLAALERSHIADALARAGGSRQRASKLLGISKPTLWRKMNLYGWLYVNWGEEREAAEAGRTTDFGVDKEEGMDERED